MKRAAFVIGTLIFGLTCGNAGMAGSVSAPEWQKESLKGITSLRYGVADNAVADAEKVVGVSLSESKLPIKHVEDLHDDASNALSPTEARVKIVAQDRKNNECWVGLYVEQRCQLQRSPSTYVESETYQLGKMCPQSQVKSTLKDLCAQFVRDLSTQTPSSPL
jgi:hypothetical protein